LETFVHRGLNGITRGKKKSKAEKKKKKQF